MRSDDPAAAGDTVRGDRDLWDEVFASAESGDRVETRRTQTQGRGRCGWCRNARDCVIGADSIGSRPGGVGCGHVPSVAGASGDDPQT